MFRLSAKSRHRAYRAHALNTELSDRTMRCTYWSIYTPPQMFPMSVYRIFKIDGGVFVVELLLKTQQAVTPIKKHY